MDRRYWVDDYARYHLREPGRDRRWVRQSDNEYLLVEIATGDCRRPASLKRPATSTRAICLGADTLRPGPPRSAVFAPTAPRPPPRPAMQALPQRDIPAHQRCGK